MSDWRHLSDTTPKARKVHRCFLCCNDIESGEVYRKRIGVDQNGLLVMHCHKGCLDFADATFELIDWECFSPGDSEFRKYAEEWANQKEAPK